MKREPPPPLRAGLPRSSRLDVREDLRSLSSSSSLRDDFLLFFSLSSLSLSSFFFVDDDDEVFFALDDDDVGFSFFDELSVESFFLPSFLSDFSPSASVVVFLSVAISLSSPSSALSAPSSPSTCSFFSL